MSTLTKLWYFHAVKRPLQRYSVLFSLVLLVQLAMPWHMLHMQAVAADSADHSSQIQAAPPCHPGPTTQPEPEEAADPIAGFCEWLCAQGQTAPLLDGLVMVRKVLRPVALFVASGSDSLPDGVPNPPPIA